jgi:CSLREA domain-containing protein
MSRLQSSLFSVIVILSSILCFASQSFCADFHVTKTEDTNDGSCDADCSLREAIIEANGLSSAASIIIHVPAGNYYITIEGINEDEAATGDLDITNSMTIVGAGMDETVINALGPVFGVVNDRVFHVNANNGNVSFEDLGIYGGYVTTGNFIQSGGGILVTNALHVNLLRCYLYNNYANSGGGAIYFAGDFNPFSTLLTITESVINRNEANGEGGGVFINNIGFVLDSSTVMDNTSRSGGGLFARSSHTKIINSTFYKNVATVASEINFIDGGYGFLDHSTLVSSDLNKNILYSGDGLVEFRNSIIWGECYSENPESYITWGGNLGEPSNTCDFDITKHDIILESDPILLPLGDYGGPTPTAPPGLLSLAIANGVDDPSNPGIDQRGVVRPQATKGPVAAYDIGSVERENFENIFKEIIKDLKRMVKAPSIPAGIQKSLYHKVESSDMNYDKGNFIPAANELGALNNSVEALREKALTVNQADNIIITSNEAIMFLKNGD